MMSDANPRTRIDCVQTFLAWWTRVIELTEEDPGNAGARNLLQGLHAFGKRAGVTEPFRERGDSPLGERFSKGSRAQKGLA